MNTDWPLVSVLMTTRGRPELVRESIAAVVGQSYPGNIECIVVHDQEAPDESLKALGTAQHTIRVAANRRTPGEAGARNTGFELATGDYLASCDDDDVWHPGKLEAQVKRLLDEPDLLVMGCGMRLLLPGNRIFDWPARWERVSYELLLRNRVKELNCSTLVMRRAAFDKAGLYEEELPCGEDYDWVLRAGKAGGIGLVKQPLADIRKDGTSWYEGAADKSLEGLEYLLAHHPDIATSRRGHARMLGQIAYAQSALGQRGPALRSTVKSLTRWPLSVYPYIALVQITTRIHPRYVLRAAQLLGRGQA